MSKRYSFKYKLRPGDNYKNLSQRFGTVLLGNAGIFGDEDLKKDYEYTFNVNSKEEAETAQKKDLEYQTKRNQAIARKENEKLFDNWWNQNGENFLVRHFKNEYIDPQSGEKIRSRLREQYVQGGGDINDIMEKYQLREDAFWQGQKDLSDASLVANKETIKQNAAREYQARIKRNNARNTQETAINNIKDLDEQIKIEEDKLKKGLENNYTDLIRQRTSEYIALENANNELGENAQVYTNLGRFNRYHTGRVDYLRANGNKGIIGRGLTLNGNDGLSYQSSMENLQDQQELGQDLKDYAKTGAGAAVGLAAGSVGLSTLPSKFLTQMATSTVADTATRKGLDYAGVDKNSYLYKTLPLATAIFAGNVSTAVPEYFALKSAVKSAPEYAKYLIKNGVSASAQNSNSLKGVLAHEFFNSAAGSIPAYPISQGLQSLGVNETVADIVGAGVGGLWGAKNTANAHRAYHFTTGSGGQIGLKNVAKNYLANGMNSQQYEALNGIQKGFLGAKQIGKGLLNIAVPVKNWGHGGYSAVYESDLGATVARAGDMVRRAPKGVKGAVDAAYNLDVTPTSTYNVGDYMGAQDAKSLSLIQQLHQGLEPIYGKRVGGNRMMSMFSNLPEEEATKILKGMTVDVDGVATPLVRDGNIDSNVLRKALRYNADFNAPYIKTSSGNYQPYKGSQLFVNNEGNMLPVKRFLGKNYIKTGSLRYKKVNTDISDKNVKLFGLSDDGSFARLQQYKSIKNNKNVSMPKTSQGIPFTGYGQNTTVGNVYLDVNSNGVPTAKALAQDIRGHVDVVGNYNGNNVTISLDPYATGSGTNNSIGGFFAKFLDRNMKRTPISVNFNTGSSTYGGSSGKKLFMPFEINPKSVTGNVNKYYEVVNHPEFSSNLGKKTFTLESKGYRYNAKEYDKINQFREFIDRFTSHKRGGKLLPKIIGL